MCVRDYFVYSYVFFFQAEDGIRDKLVTGVQTCAFFFQAEDGIRGKLVTGVQTCALPIFTLSSGCSQSSARHTSQPRTRSTDDGFARSACTVCRATATCVSRSEERRVGKGWRSRGSAKRVKRKEERRVGKERR